MGTDSSGSRSGDRVSSMERSPHGRLADHERGISAPATAGFAAAGLLLSAAAVWVSLASDTSPTPWLAATAHALVIAASIGAGLYALRTQPAPARRFGWLLVVAGLLWAPTLLAESNDSLLYSIGRVWSWAAEVLIAYVVLAFPSGRLVSRTDRLLIRAGVLLVVMLFLPTALFVDQYPAPNPWSSCGTDCPPNAFMVADSEPGIVSDFMAPLAQILTAAIYVALALALAGRLVHGSRLTRVAVKPVVVVALIRMVVAAAFIAVRAGSPESDLTVVLGDITLLCGPAFSFAFVAGLVSSRRAAARALTQLGAGFGSRPGRVELRDAIAEAVDDQSLEIFYWTTEDPGGWVDADGNPVALPPASFERGLTEIRGSRGRVAVLVHDADLEYAPVVTDVARGFALMALENQRLETELTSSLRELRASRRRIMSAADEERRRIERDLHDGAQQRLVGLGIQLELAGDLVEADPDRAARRLRELAREVDDAVDEVRALAHGLVPPLLVERGLPDALRDAVAGAPKGVAVNADGLGRYGPEIESAVYFCCLEALQNAAKHAKGARSVSVKLWEDEELRFEVRDDGCGLPDGPHQVGAGLTNMRDRIGAVGGRLTIESAPGEGTRVAGAVPVTPIDLPAQVETLLRRATDALEDCFAVYRPVRGEDGIVVDFMIEHANEAACADMGSTREQLVGRNLGELCPGYPDSADFRWLRRVLESGERDSRTSFEYAENDAGGGRLLERARDMRAAPLGGGRIVVSWWDVTERARAEQRLRLRSLALDNEAEGVCLVRAADGEIVYGNPHLAELLGFGPGELDGRLVPEIAVAVESGGDRTFEVLGRRKDGAIVRCEARVSEFDDPHHGTVWVAVVREMAGARRPSRRAEFVLQKVRSRD